MSIQRVASKWHKTTVLEQNKHIFKFVPLTQPYNCDSLKSMLEKFSNVFIKPDRGTHGNGVMQLKLVPAKNENLPEKQLPGPYCIKSVLYQNKPICNDRCYYELHINTEKKNFYSLDEVNVALKSIIEDKPYLVQQGIELLQYKRRPFDLRIFVQKNLNNEWEVTGIRGRVASPNKVITNLNNGGSDCSYEKLVLHYLTRSESVKMKKKLFSLSIETANQLEKTFPLLKEIGLDIALDCTFYPWILEVNTKPGIKRYAKIFDKHTYQRIQKYAKNYA